MRRSTAYTRDAGKLRKQLSETEAMLTLTEAALKACNEERIKALEELSYYAARAICAPYTEGAK